MTDKEFHNWLAKAKPGEKCVYAPAAGFLSTGNETKHAAMGAFMGGLVHLFQRPVPNSQFIDGGRRFDYIAVRKGPGK